MKKNGFIATSLLYAFFLVFISLFLVLLLNYLHNRLLIQKIDDNARDILSGINNTKLTQLKVGDYVVWKNASPTAASNPLSEEGKWQVYQVSNDGKSIYMLSDLNASSTSVYYKLGSDRVNKKHPMAIEVFYQMNRAGLYTRSLEFKNYTSMNIDLVDAATLASIRDNATMDPYTKRELFNMKGSYIISVNNNYAGYGYKPTFTYPTGINGSYYLYKAYTFDNYRKTGDTSLLNKKALLESYCGASYNTSTNSPVYSYTAGGTVRNNPFGYVDVTDDSSKNDAGEIIHTQYLDFCYFASPVAYEHKTSDLIVIENESKNADGDFINTTLSPIYKLRFKMELVLNSSPNIYIAGGKGIVNDPYIITNGVHVQ